MIYTVTGPISKEELGVTLSHEHIAWDPQADERLYFDKTYDQDKIEQLYQKILPIFKRLYQAGCRAVAETSPPEGGQNLMLMNKLSKASGVKIIPNTGLFFSKNVYRIHRENYSKELAARWAEDFEKGLDTIDGVIIRPSHIKIFVERGKLSEVDKKILEAAAAASKAAGLPVHCHIIEAASANEVFDFLEAIKCDFSKFLWAHASYEGNRETIERAAAMGMWLGFDTVRREHYPKHCGLIKEALRRGFHDRVLLSQDLDFSDEAQAKEDSQPSTGIFTDFIPYCEAEGLSKETILRIMTVNPANFYNI